MIEAEDRRAALQLLGERGLFPSKLETASATGAAAPTPALRRQQSADFRLGSGVRRKEITAFTREMGALLAAGIPIPQALEAWAKRRKIRRLRRGRLKIARFRAQRGRRFPRRLDEHPALFSKLYVSMVRVGEEARRTAQGHGGPGGLAGARG